MSSPARRNSHVVLCASDLTADAHSRCDFDPFLSCLLIDHGGFRNPHGRPTLYSRRFVFCAFCLSRVESLTAPRGGKGISGSADVEIQQPNGARNGYRLSRIHLDLERIC